MTTRDTYNIYDDHAIVHSGTSKRDYLVKLPSLECNCTGYTYRQSCRHSDLIAQVTLDHPLRRVPQQPKEWEPSETQQSILSQILRGNQQG